MAIRAIVDTNVVLSGFISHRGPPSKIIDAWIQNDFMPIVSPALIKEYNAVLQYDRIQKYLGNKFQTAQKTLKAMLSKAEKTFSKEVIHLFKDTHDDMLIEAAISGEANFIVSGDREVLEVQKYKTIEIISADSFFKLLCNERL